MILTLAAAGLTPAAAHRQHVAQTVVTLTQDGRAQVVHTLHAHDVEPAIGLIQRADGAKGGPAAGKPIVIDGLKSRALAALYVAERFELSADGRPVDLTVLGAEREGQHLYVYQEAAVGAPQAITVQARMLFEAYGDQRNRVTVVWPGGEPTTVDLRPGDAPAVLSRPGAT